MEEFISLSHGNGGVKTCEIIEKLILPQLNNLQLANLGDGALLDLKGKIAFSTDSFVIDPIFFNGGDIGKLSICGTANDLMMCGAVPKFMSLSFILEEGFSIEKFQNIINSIKKICEKINVQIVTGDTKVVDKGHGHGIYINTSGIGEVIEDFNLGTNRIEVGDQVILTGSCGNHGISILCTREKIFEEEILSDCTVLDDIFNAILPFSKEIKFMRDPTRGGVATTLNEFIENTKLSIEILENKIPIDEEVIAACDILGLDPLYSANEGKAIVVVKRESAKDILEAIRKTENGKNAEIIGEVVDYISSKVILKNEFGGKRILDKLANDMLPRIC